MKRCLLGAAGAVLLLVVAPAYAEDLPPLRTGSTSTSPNLLRKPRISRIGGRAAFFNDESSRSAGDETSTSLVQLQDGVCGVGS